MAKKRYKHDNPEDIFKQAEAWWITNFLAEVEGKLHWKEPVPPGGGIPKESYAVKYLSTSAACQALKSPHFRQKDKSFHATLERSSKAFENFRYIFMSNPKIMVEINVSLTVHACKSLIKELKPDASDISLSK